MLSILKEQRSFKIRSNIILLIAGIGFTYISCLFLWYELIAAKEYIYYRYKDKIHSIEYTFNNEIADAKHIIYGLSTTISDKSIISNHNKLIELIQNFDPKYNSDDEFSIPLSDIFFISANGADIIYKTSSNTNKHNRDKDLPDIKLCLQERGLDFFQVNIAPIRIGSSIKEPIIPINVTISDSNNNFLGTLCSGLIVRELTKKLNVHFDSRYFDSIKIESRNLKNYKNISSSDLKSLLETNYFNPNLTLKHNLQKYPFLLEIKLRHSHLKNKLYKFILFSLSAFMILIITSYLISKNFKNYYISPLMLSYKKLISLNQFLSNKDNDILHNSNNFLETHFSPIKFSDAVNTLVETHYTFISDRTLNSPESREIERKIRNLIFIEQHFMSIQKNKISKEKIFSNKLYELTHEEFITLPLDDFLRQLVDYCSAFYHELSIRLTITEKDKRNFSFKQAALIETIFSIITFILRSAIYNEDGEISIKAEFQDDNDFPTIIIGVDITEETDNLNNLGWEVGPYYTHTSLLAIFLLAKENDLFFNVSKKENTIFFVLESITKKIEFYNLANLNT